MKKHYILLCLILIVTTLFVSCGNKAKEEASTTTKTTNKVSISFLNSKGEIQDSLEQLAKEYEKETGVKVEILACGAGEVPYTKITTMYNSGNAPTLAMLDTLDVLALAKEYALDLSNEKWIADTESQIVKLDGKVYSFPFCVEGRGIIYNKKAIEDTLGHSFDPTSINSTTALSSLLQELRANGMTNPVFLAKEDWSLGAHQLGFLYDAYDGTTEGSAVIINKLKQGDNPLTIDRFNQFMDTLDLLIEYNVYKADPIGADYDEGALKLADGEVALWPNGCWAWPNLAEGGAKTSDEFGFLPFTLGSDTTDFANTDIQASASKQVMIDKKQASSEQVQEAKDFLNWLVYSENGQKLLVEKCAIIPAASNNPNKPADPLGTDIVNKLASGNVYNSCFIAPSDHWSSMGAALQKYISGNSSRGEFAATLSAYWKAQN